MHRRVIMEFGIGSDIRGSDYTKAACRAVFNALRQNSISVAPALGVSRDQMHCDIIIGVQNPGAVDVDEVAAMLPYGTCSVTVEMGGLDTARETGADGAMIDPTILANAAILVHVDLSDSQVAKLKGTP